MDRDEEEGRERKRARPAQGRWFPIQTSKAWTHERKEEDETVSDASFGSRDKGKRVRRTLVTNQIPTVSHPPPLPPGPAWIFLTDWMLMQACKDEVREKRGEEVSFDVGLGRQRSLSSDDPPRHYLSLHRRSRRETSSAKGRASLDEGGRRKRTKPSNSPISPTHPGSPFLLDLGLQEGLIDRKRGSSVGSDR